MGEDIEVVWVMKYVGSWRCERRRERKTGSTGWLNSSYVDGIIWKIRGWSSGEDRRLVV